MYNRVQRNAALRSSTCSAAASFTSSNTVVWRLSDSRSISPESGKERQCLSHEVKAVS